MLELTITTGPRKGLTFELSEDQPHLIGRQEGLVSLYDAQVSRQHSQISFENDCWVIRDLESSNGTFVNGHRIDSLTELEVGDKIRIGRVYMSVAFTPMSTHVEAEVVKIIVEDKLVEPVEVVETAVSEVDTVEVEVLEFEVADSVDQVLAAELVELEADIEAHAPVDESIQAGSDEDDIIAEADVIIEEDVDLVAAEEVLPEEVVLEDDVVIEELPADPAQVDRDSWIAPLADMPVAEGLSHDEELAQASAEEPAETELHPDEVLPTLSDQEHQELSKSSPMADTDASVDALQEPIVLAVASAAVVDTASFALPEDDEAGTDRFHSDLEVESTASPLPGASDGCGGGAGTCGA